MSSQPINAIILEYLSRLNVNQQSEVLKYIKSLITKKEGDRSELLKLSGSIPSSEIKKIQKAIKDDCKRIDHEEW